MFDEMIGIESCWIYSKVMMEISGLASGVIQVDLTAEDPTASLTCPQT